ncbi:protein stum homolog isoform X1 [Kogia breviceps]|uniref:protein stum homolog isoform X1 n=1 Tax=Kogia breviceps TaxID=27615 RepID=UPI0034D18371
MEPSHKDAETAAAAAAVAAAAAADRGTSSSSGVVVQVREKKGPLRAAIPYMPFPVAVICLFLNTFVPGLGTFVSAFTVLCGARTDLPDRHVCCVFWLNIAAALIQMLTAIVMVGWIMSIFWGMDMVILAKLGRSLTGPRCLPPSPSAAFAVGVLPVTKLALLQGGPCLPSDFFLASPFSWEACTSYSSKAHMSGNLIPSQPGVCALNRVLDPDWVFQK